MYRKILSQISITKKRVRTLQKFNDDFTLNYIYFKIEKMNKELKSRLREWEQWKREKK